MPLRTTGVQAIRGPGSEIPRQLILQACAEEDDCATVFSMRSGTALVIKGDLKAGEDVTIDGLFEGTIDLQGHHLIAVAGARVRAAVTARTVTIDGYLEGHITAERVDIGPNATVEANVIARHFALEEGAHFRGAVNTERARAAGNIARHRQLQGKMS